MFSRIDIQEHLQLDDTQCPSTDVLTWMSEMFSVKFRAANWYHVKYFHNILKEVQRISILIWEKDWWKQCFMYDSEGELLETKYKCFISKGSNSKLLINFDLTHTIHRNKTFE